MRIVVTKRSVRRLVHLKRLPSRFRMFVAGCWLYEVLRANRLHKKIHLWDLTYWVRCSSLDTRQVTLVWDGGRRCR
jgi:hypothetical protein